MSGWFDDENTKPSNSAARPNVQDREDPIRPAVVRPEPKGLLVQDQETGEDFDWGNEQPRDVEETLEENAAIEDDAAEPVEASIELTRDQFYDGMSKVGVVVGAGAVAGVPHADIAGKVIGGTAFVGKQVGKFLDGAADYADKAAQHRHENGDMKRTQNQKDQQALDRINKGMPKGSRVTKDD